MIGQVKWTWWFSLILTILVVLLPAMFCNALAFIMSPSPSSQTRQRLARALEDADRKLHGLWNESDGSRIGKPLSEVAAAAAPTAKDAATSGRPSSPSLDTPTPLPTSTTKRKPALHKGESSFLAQVSAERRSLRARSTLTSGEVSLAEGSRTQNRRRASSDFAYSVDEASEMHILAHFGLGSKSFVNTLYAGTFVARLSSMASGRPSSAKGGAGARSGSASRQRNGRSSPTAGRVTPDPQSSPQPPRRSGTPDAPPAAEAPPPCIAESGAFPPAPSTPRPQPVRAGAPGSLPPSAPTSHQATPALRPGTGPPGGVLPPLDVNTQPPEVNQAAPPPRAAEESYSRTHKPSTGY